MSALRPVRRPQARQEIDQRRHLVRADLLSIGRHVAAAGRAVADLVDELVGRQPCADQRQVGAALPADALEGVAVAAILVLKDHGPLQLPRRASSTMSSGTARRSRQSSPATRAPSHPGRSRLQKIVKITITASTATGRRLGRAFAAIGHERHREQRQIKTTGNTRMMNVSARRD